MKRRDFSLSLALCSSLLLHGSLAFWVVHYHGDALSFLAPRHDVVPSTRPVAEDEHPIYDPQPPPVAPPVPVETPDSKFGAAEGMGKAINEISGDRPQKARQAPEDQAFLSKDPAGHAAVGEIGSAVNPAADSSATGKISLSAPPAILAPIVPPTPRHIAADTFAIGPRATTIPAVATPSPPPVPPAEPVQQAIAKAAAADPAPKSDSESDPFSIAGSVEFVAGRVEAHMGRKVKTTRPKLTLAGRNDVLSMGGATVQLKVMTDAAGNVRNVDILHSSGSNEIDQPCRVAVYDWWFEPPKNSAGQPIADAIVFNITWRW